jgi:hypothetical protein
MKHIVQSALKTLKNIERSMLQKDFVADAKNAAEYFEKEIKKLFPNAHQVVSKVDLHGLGSTMDFYYYGDEYAVTRHNAEYGIQLICHLDTSSSRRSPETVEVDKFEIDVLNWSYQWKARGLKYRKISGKTPMEATKKLVAWFAKNKDIIKND